MTTSRYVISVVPLNSEHHLIIGRAPRVFMRETSPVTGRDSTGSKVTKLTPSVACVDVMSGKLRGNFERERRACTHSA